MLLDEPGCATPVIYREFNSRRRFGVELEVGNERTQGFIKDVIKKVSQRDIQVTGWQQSINNNFWHVKYDSTCGVHGKDDHGWEVASPVSCGYKDLMHISKVANALRRAKLLVNPHCGFHVHVDISDFSGEHAAIMMARWFKLEPLMAMTVPGHRLTNDYCKFFHPTATYSFRRGIYISRKAVYQPHVFWNLIKPDNFSPYENMQKRYAVNLINFAYALSREERKVPADSRTRKTVEFRFPEGTLDGATIQNWVRLFINFVDLSKNAPMTNITPDVGLINFLRCLGLEGWDEFYILCPALRKLKMWLLERMKKNIRSAIDGVHSGVFMPDENASTVRNILKNVENKINGMKEDKA